MSSSGWWSRVVVQLAILAALCGGSSVSAQQPDTSHPAPAPPPAAARPSGPTYPLAPSGLLGMGSLTPRVAMSGYLFARATHRHDSTAAAITRARLTGQVAPLPYLGIRLQAEFASSQAGKLRLDSTVAGFTLTDAYLELIPPPATTARSPLLKQIRPSLLVGQVKDPFSLEYQTPITVIKTVDRSQVVDRYSLKRDIGVTLQGGWSHYGALAAAVVNGEGANATTNPDNRAQVISRLTLTPLRVLALSAKVANQGGDHAWGYDGRLLWRGLTVEGETIFRKRPTSSTVKLDAGGGYALIACHVLPWLEPVYKYDRFWETRTTTRPTGVTTASASGTWNVLGVNVSTVPRWLTLQLDWARRDERPTPGRTNQLVAQLVTIF